jgi:hypothetical protein
MQQKGAHGRSEIGGLLLGGLISDCPGAVIASVVFH